MSYEIKQTFASPLYGNLVLEAGTNRLLAGVGHNAHRAWTFPLNTPRGLNVIQEYSFDHPFHNGIFVGQGNVRQGERMANFWAPAFDWRQAANPAFQHLGQLKYGEPPRMAVQADGVVFTYNTVWNDEVGQPMLNEARTIRISSTEDATVCDVTSAKTAAYGPVGFGNTKFGTIGARVQPQLLPVLGGQIIGAKDGELRRGTADEVASAKACDAVAYENELPALGRFGLCLMIRDNTASTNRQGPWFIRDYGMAMFNATMTESISLAEGATWTTTLRVAAYDGALTWERVQAWGHEI